MLEVLRAPLRLFLVDDTAVVQRNVLVLLEKVVLVVLSPNFSLRPYSS